MARAQQAVVVDATYEHSAETTSDSHYYPELRPETPDNFRSPIDFASGSVHMRLEADGGAVADAGVAGGRGAGGCPAVALTLAPLLVLAFRRRYIR